MGFIHLFKALVVNAYVEMVISGFRFTDAGFDAMEFSGAPFNTAVSQIGLLPAAYIQQRAFIYMGAKAEYI